MTVTASVFHKADCVVARLYHWEVVSGFLAEDFSVKLLMRLFDLPKATLGLIVATYSKIVT